jgi:hypothetical protein
MMVVHGGSEMDVLLRRQQELVIQLRALILPALRDADSRSADHAVDLFDGVIDCITGVISRLQSITTAGREPEAVFILSDVISNGASEGQEEKPVISNAGQKRRFLICQ